MVFSLTQFSSHRPTILFTSWLFILVSATSCGPTDDAIQTKSNLQAVADPAEVSAGERLFIETRFAQAFKAYLDAGGSINGDMFPGDSVMDLSETKGVGVGLPGPFAGSSMNCRSCHLVDEYATESDAGMRGYVDFAQRSPVPDRGDGKRTAPRNSPSLVNASLNRPVGELFHFDGEFSSMVDLVEGTFTGRNFGWLPGEKTEAVRHLARVIREDDGNGIVAQDFDGLPYRTLLRANGAEVPAEFRLPNGFQLDVQSASDEAIFEVVAKLVSAYVQQLEFSDQEDSGALIRSPFDVFLQRNDLPGNARENETAIEFSRRLRSLLNSLEAPRFVNSNPNRADGQFQFHQQAFQFGATELAGLKVFLAEPQQATASAAELSEGKIGNCLACHALPQFTDFKFHNTGVTQKQYDSLSSHGPGAFMSLAIPSLGSRSAQDLPATEQHPAASDRFKSIAQEGSSLTDLGLWNVFANPDMPNPQAKIRAILCDLEIPCTLSDEALLGRSIGRFKTPGLRNLGHSEPYTHNGQFDRLEDVIALYIEVTALARAGSVRNGADELRAMALAPSDIDTLVAFLRSLNEDYQ